MCHFNFEAHREHEDGKWISVFKPFFHFDCNVRLSVWQFCYGCGWECSSSCSTRIYGCFLCWLFVVNLHLAKWNAKKKQPSETLIRFTEFIRLSCGSNLNYFAGGLRRSAFWMRLAGCLAAATAYNIKFNEAQSLWRCHPYKQTENLLRRVISAPISLQNPIRRKAKREGKNPTMIGISSRSEIKNKYKVSALSDTKFFPRQIVLQSVRLGSRLSQRALATCKYEYLFCSVLTMLCVSQAMTTNIARAENIACTAHGNDPDTRDPSAWAEMRNNAAAGCQLH